jgi:hypothetical protein
MLQYLTYSKVYNKKTGMLGFRQYVPAINKINLEGYKLFGVLSYHRLYSTVFKEEKEAKY